MKKVWVTIFPHLENVHLVKDVGQIPFIMGKYYDYDSYIATLESDLKYDNDDRYLKVKKVKKKTGNDKLDFFLYLIKQSKNIDVLNMYHMSLAEAVLWVLPYKILNPKGKVYLKMDLSMMYVEDYTKNKIMMFLRKNLLSLYKLVTAESNVVCRYMNNYYKNKIKYLPNGYYWGFDINCENRENTVVHVARLGAKEKLSDVLVQAFAQTVDYHDWNLKLIGPIEDDFKNWLENYIKANKKLENRILYAGQIQDRKKLAEQYASAKILALSSVYESFGLVLVEALSQGCYLVSTDTVNSVADIIADESIGRSCKANDIKDLAKVLQKSIVEFDNRQEAFLYRKEYAKQEYDWVKLCGKINDWLEE